MVGQSVDVRNVGKKADGTSKYGGTSKSVGGSSSCDVLGFKKALSEAVDYVFDDEVSGLICFHV